MPLAKPETPRESPKTPLEKSHSQMKLPQAPLVRSKTLL